MHMAYAIGKPRGYGLTLAAIVVRESFVEDEIVRMNNKDGAHGSYGITHVQLSTAMFIYGVGSVWRGKATLFERLVTDDQFSIRTSLIYLEMVETSTWRNTVRNYNGAGWRAENYADAITAIVDNFIECGTFNYG